MSSIWQLGDLEYQLMFNLTIQDCDLIYQNQRYIQPIDQEAVTVRALCATFHAIKNNIAVPTGARYILQKFIPILVKIDSRFATTDSPNQINDSFVTTLAHTCLKAAPDTLLSDVIKEN